ncbi:hypothetical protein HZF02_17695 [Pseudomonas yamanorum]|nr:hypothetical protein HZF02_17695 [Pseudomonas yamanorum]
MNRSNLSNPAVILAAGVAAGAVLWGIAQLLPAIAAFFGILIQAIAAAAGLAVAVATTGFATAGSVAAWLPIAATVGVGAAGASATYLVVVRIIDKGKEHPYQWLLPALAALAVFCVDLTKDQLVTTGLERALYGLTTTVLTIAGGWLLMTRQLSVRLIGFLLPFLPSIAICLLLLKQQHVNGALSDFIASGSVGAIGLMGAISMAFIVGALGLLLPHAK